MKNLLLSALLCVVAVFAAAADDFKILYLTTPDITVGGKTLRVGDTFAGTAPISWTAPRQAMKVLNTTTKNQSLVVAEKLPRMQVARHGVVSCGVETAVDTSGRADKHP